MSFAQMRYSKSRLHKAWEGTSQSDAGKWSMQESSALRGCCRRPALDCHNALPKSHLAE